MIEVENLSKFYGPRQAVKNISFRVEKGDVVGFLGPNGAGKSTLLRVMALLESPTNGKVFFQGREVNQGNGLSVRRRMASVFLEPFLLNASVYENAALGLKLKQFSEV